MINWDPKAQTALSDEEVIPTKQKGSLYYVRYEVVDEPGRFLEVATTRPETIMADTGWRCIRRTSATGTCWAKKSGDRSRAKSCRSSPTRRSIRSSAPGF